MKIPLEHPTPLTHRFLRSLATAVLCASVFTGMGLSARAADKPASDVLVFLNGDKITGQLEKVTGGTVFFKTDGAGELQVPWAKIKELHTDEPFAVILTNAKVRRRHRNRQVSVGSLNVEDQNLTVHTEAGEQVIPVSTIAFLVDEKSYRNDVDHTPGLAHGWVGAITAGAGTVTSTQNSVSYNAGIALARTIPSSTWLAPSYRTLLGFTTNYGRISQPATPTVKTNIFHALAEQDKYLSPRLYALAEAVFDHSSTQGLDLQSMYGGGLGYTVLKSPKQELDLTGTVDYTKQEFEDSSSNLNLVGINAGDSYFYKFPRSIMFTELASITPQLNNSDAWSANASAGLTLPVVKKLAFSVGVADSYLNLPSPGFKNNSFQFNMGLTYTLP